MIIEFILFIKIGHLKNKMEDAVKLYSLYY